MSNSNDNQESNDKSFDDLFEKLSESSSKVDRYKCIVCDMDIGIEHKKTQHTRIGQKSNESNEETMTKKRLTLNSKHMDYQNKCDRKDCKFTSNNNQEIAEHKRKEHSTLKCDYEGCDFDTHLIYLLDKHRKTHPNYKCDFKDYDNICGFVTRNKKHFERHKLLHKDNRYKCDEIGCYYIASQSTHLKQHKRNIHDKRLKCDYNTYSYYSHKFTHNKMPYKCGINGCGFDANTEPEIKVHKKLVHTGNKIFVCAEYGCEFASDDINEFERHNDLRHEDLNLNE